jgi:hypothetical protein
MGTAIDGCWYGKHPVTVFAVTDFWTAFQWSSYFSNLGIRYIIIPSPEEINYGKVKACKRILTKWCHYCFQITVLLNNSIHVKHRSEENIWN